MEYLPSANPIALVLGAIGKKEGDGARVIGRHL